MCGIAGFLQSRNFPEHASVIVERMATAVSHRGPDDSGVWVEPCAGVALGHRRLAVIDLSSAGHQPMTSPSGRFVIVYNGEIYNFSDIRAELDAGRAQSHWRGSSDTEVLLAAVDRWGARETLQRLNGMFAFALWDRQLRVLTLARDRMGEKPIYYGRAGDTFLFGSELKALRQHPGFAGEVDPSAVAAMLRYDQVPAPATIWRGISKLQPGHFVQIGDGGRRVGDATPYWRLRDHDAPDPEAPPRPDGELDRLELLLKDAVARRMLADVPLGAFLSGGIDSSLIVALMQAQAPRPVKTFTIGFEDSAFDEAPFAKQVAAHFGTEHTELYVTPKDALDVIPRIPEIWDEPFGDSSQIPTFLVSAMARREVTVALSGDGGDELFGGYGRYKSVPDLWAALGQFPLPLRTFVASAIGAGTWQSPLPGTRGRVARIVQSHSFEELYEWKVSRVQCSNSLVLGNIEHAPAAEAFPFISSPSSKMLYRDILHHLPDDILTKVDRASMAVSLEVRAPFLDHRVVEMAWRLPMCAKLGGGGKAILRAMLRRYLPGELVDRRKTGFSVPVERWLRGPLRGWAEGLLSRDRLARQGMLDPIAVRRIWDGFLSGKRRHDRVVWNLLMLQAWLGEDANKVPTRSRGVGVASAASAKAPEQRQWASP